MIVGMPYSKNTLRNIITNLAYYKCDFNIFLTTKKLL